MKKLFPFIMVLALGMIVPQAARATNYTLLELLIKNHKVQSDRLKTRISLNGSATATQLLKEDRSEQLKLKIDTLSNRFSGALMDMTLVLDAAGIMTEVATVLVSTEKAVSKALSISIDHPEVWFKAYYLQQRAAEKIEDIYAICKQLATNGIKASLATKEQRKRFVWAIRSRLSWLAMTMQNFHYYCMVRSHVPKKYSHNAVQQVILTDGQAERSAFEKAMVLVNDLHLW